MQRLFVIIPFKIKITEKLRTVLPDFLFLSWNRKF